jgi:hypothetical protein
MERRSGKRSSSVGKEKMEKFSDTLDKMEGHCSTGQSPQWAVVPMEEEEVKQKISHYMYHHNELNL